MESVLRLAGGDFVTQNGERYYHAEDVLVYEGEKMRLWQVQAVNRRKTFDGYVPAFTYEEAEHKALA